MRNAPDKLEPRLPLNYADPALVREDRERRRDGTTGQGMRRLGFGFGLAFILIGYGVMEHPSREEALFWLGLGGFLFGAAVPSLQPRRTSND